MVKVGEEEGEVWFPKHVSSVLGDGKRIGFWKEKWIGAAPLQELFPNLFAKESDQYVEVAKRLVGSSANRMWNWNWCINLTAEEEVELLVGVEVVENQRDNWRWILDNSGIFSVKSVYGLLLNGRIVSELYQSTLAALESLWKNDVPSKVGIFGWRLILEKLPTRADLAYR
ncbi:cysteine-rich receptor-like protein kinase, partial [Trifolium pratense]